MSSNAHNVSSKPDERRCPRCGEEVSLVDPTDDVWMLNPEDYDEDAEVWLCVDCNWNEEADPDEALEEHMANLEWVMERLAGMSE